MAFDDLTRRMGQRHGISPALLADPAALARKSEGDRHLAMLIFGIMLVVGVGALTVGLAATGWWMPAASGVLLLGGVAAAGSGARGLRASAAQARTTRSAR